MFLSQIRTLAVLVIAALSTACGVAKFQDVSQEPEFRSIVGNSYTTLKKMNLSGVNLPPGYGRSIDIFYVERTSPSWSGPELILRKSICPGLVVTVIAVERCTNCYFDGEPRIYYKVAVDLDEVENTPVVIKGRDFDDEHFAEKQAET